MEHNETSNPKNPFIFDAVVSIILLSLLVTLINPFGFWMLTMFHMMLVLAVLVVFAVFLLFLWKESPKDERETLHQSLAGRTAYLAGSVLLLAGIVYQAYRGYRIDRWLVIAFAGMVLAKIIALAYARRNK